MQTRHTNFADRSTGLLTQYAPPTSEGDDSSRHVLQYHTTPTPVNQCSEVRSSDHTERTLYCIEMTDRYSCNSVWKVSLIGLRSNKNYPSYSIGSSMTNVKDTAAFSLGGKFPTVMVNTSSLSDSMRNAEWPLAMASSYVS